MVEVLDISQLDRETLKLAKMAARVRKKAYAPYSRFLVGSTIVDNRGKIHTGCNFENASYGAGICAERNAVGKMVSRGGKKIKRVLIVTSSTEPVFPCGICLQVLCEFGPDMQIISLDKKLTKFASVRLAELYPHGFSGRDLLR